MWISVLSMKLGVLSESCLFISSGPRVSSGVAAGPRLDNNQLYKFSYTTEVLLDKARRSREGGAGYRISSDVNVNLVWRDPGSKDDQLVRLVVRWSSYMSGEDVMD